MAHLVCLTHGRRSIVAEHPRSIRRNRVYHVLHRGDRDVCMDDTVRHGKHEFSLVAVAQAGPLKAHKFSMAGPNWTESSEPARPKRHKPRRR